MALAWNAGWVNSPRGFKSRILRTRSEARPDQNRARLAPRAALNSPAIRRWRGTYRRHDLARAVRGHRRRLVLPFRAAPLVGADRLHPAHAWDGAADRGGGTDRPVGAAGGVHPVTDPQAAVPYPAAGADAAGRLDRGPRAGRGVDRWHRDQRDLAQPGRLRAVVVRDLRRRRGGRAAWHRSLVPVVRRRAAAAPAEAV